MTNTTDNTVHKSDTSKNSKPYTAHEAYCKSGIDPEGDHSNSETKWVSTYI